MPARKPASKKTASKVPLRRNERPTVEARELQAIQNQADRDAEKNAKKKLAEIKKAGGAKRYRNRHVGGCPDIVEPGMECDRCAPLEVTAPSSRPFASRLPDQTVTPAKQPKAFTGVLREDLDRMISALQESRNAIPMHRLTWIFQHMTWQH